MRKFRTYLAATIGCIVASAALHTIVNSHQFVKVNATSETISFIAGTDTSEGTSIEKSGITLTATTFNNSSYYQTYKSSTFNVSSSVGNITMVEITCTASNASKYGPGGYANPTTGTYAYSGTVGTWTGSATSFTLTASTNQVRMTQVVVTYTAGSSSSTSTSSTSTSSSSSLSNSVSSSKSSSSSIPVTGISIKSTLRLVKGEGYKLTPTFTPTNATNKTVTWESNDTSVLTVDSSGNISTTSSGTANVTVTSADGGFKSTCSVFVTECATNPTLEGDILNKSFTGATGNSYVSWNDKKSVKNTYSGKSAGNNNSIQLRSSDSESGIVSKTSGMYLKKVLINLDDKTSGDRDILIFGSNSPYSNASDLYNDSTKGTLLGTLSRTRTLSLTVNDDYNYVGVRSADGTIYVISIAFVWETQSERAVSNIKNIDSNSQLRFDSLYNEGTASYSFSNIELRFGGKIPLTDWNLVNEDVVEYGCIIKYAEDLTNGLSCLRAEIDSLVDETTTLEEYVSAFDCMMVSASGNNPYIKTEGENQYALFNGVLDVEDMAYIDLQVCAVAYVKTNTEYIYLNEIKKSARMIATEYASNSEMTAKFGTEALSAFANYVVA